MKINFLYLLIFLIYSCAAQKQPSILNDYKNSIGVSLSSCQKNYSCTLKIVPNKSIHLQKDEFGSYYGRTIESDSVLIKYVLKREKRKNTMDGDFIETIYFNVSKYDTEIDLKDEELSKINLILHRQCYCKGTSGYFKVNKGNFKFNIKKNELTLAADFSIKNIPHMLQKINEKMMLAP